MDVLARISQLMGLGKSHEEATVQAQDEAQAADMGEVDQHLADIINEHRDGSMHFEGSDGSCS